MASILNDIKRSPLESIGWLLGGAGMAGIGIWFYNKYLGGNKSLENWKTNVQKELGIDRLKINKTLCFGTKSRKCPVHDEGQLLCKDLDCYYGPLGHFVDAVRMAEKTVDVAIFRINSRIIADAILDAHERGARVRIVTDADSAFASKSPLNDMRESGIQVRQRISPFHMHHKFIILDGEIVISGSMNFSDTAVTSNWENMVVTSEPGIVVPFVNEFEVLWEDFEQGKELIFTEGPKHARNIINPQRRSFVHIP